MLFKNGYVYHFQPCKVAYPVKNKFVLCVSKEKHRFYLINSYENRDGTPNGRPHSYEREFAYLIPKERLACLSRGSYIVINRLECIDGQLRSKIEEKEALPPDIWLAIKHLIKNFDKDRPRCRISKEIQDIVENAKKDK